VGRVSTNSITGSGDARGQSRAFAGSGALLKIVRDACDARNLAHNGHIAIICLDHGVPEFYTMDRDLRIFRASGGSSVSKPELRARLMKSSAVALIFSSAALLAAQTPAPAASLKTFTSSADVQALTSSATAGCDSMIGQPETIDVIDGSGSLVLRRTGSGRQLST
jgi:hypothetical protein